MKFPSFHSLRRALFRFGRARLSGKVGWAFYLGFIHKLARTSWIPSFACCFVSFSFLFHATFFQVQIWERIEAGEGHKLVVLSWLDLKNFWGRPGPKGWCWTESSRETRILILFRFGLFFFFYFDLTWTRGKKDPFFCKVERGPLIGWTEWQ